MRPGVARLADPVVGDLVAEAALDVPVDAVVGDVELAADEPLGERQVPLEGRLERLRPSRPARGRAAPRRPRSPLGLVVEVGRRVGLGGERRVDGGNVRPSARRFSISGLAEGLAASGSTLTGISAVGWRAGPAILPRHRWTSGAGRTCLVGPTALRRAAAARRPPAGSTHPAGSAGARRSRGGGRASAARCPPHRARSPGAAAARPGTDQRSAARTLPVTRRVTPVSPSAATRANRGVSSSRGAHSGSACISVPTRSMIATARSTSAPRRIAMSRSSAAYTRVRFDEIRISPFEIEWTVPLESRTMVRRRPTSSTWPWIAPTVIQSPL